MAVHDHENILVFLRWGIGDVVLQWPVLKALRRAAPHARITLVGAAPAVQLLESSGLHDELRTYQEFGMSDLGCDAAEAELRLRGYLEDRGFDAIVEPLSGPPAAAAASWSREAPVYEADRKAMADRLHAGADAAQALAAGAVSGWGLTGPHPEPPPRIELHASERSSADRSGWFEGNGEVVGIVPFASHPLKQWPPERFAELADRLTAGGAAVLLLAAPGAAAAARVFSHCAGRGRVRLVPPMALRSAAALLERCKVVIGNDTGLLHVAAAVGTPAVALFGPADARVYAPGARRDLALAPATACGFRQDRSLSSPGCWGSASCLIQERSCIEELTLAQVLERVQDAWDAPGDGAERMRVQSPKRRGVPSLAIDTVRRASS